MNKRYGRYTTVIEKSETAYELKDKDVPPNSLIKLCFSSDFFIEETGAWRDGCWDFIICPISLGKYPDTGLIKCVNVDGEMAPKADVRPIEYEWEKICIWNPKKETSNSIFIRADPCF